MIAAEGEHKASRALREASEIIGDSPAALQLRYLQVCASSDHRPVIENNSVRGPAVQVLSLLEDGSRAGFCIIAFH